MDQSVLDYIKTQRICVLAVEMLDGSPHAATVHFAHDENPLKFFFETDRRYRKAEPLLNNEETRASIVIGFDESNRKTLQMDGIIRRLNKDEQEQYRQVYLGKFPPKEIKAADPNFLPFTFTPIWWRFSDWTGPDGKKIISSDQL